MTLNLTKLIAKFRKNEDGAVTVDWVVLTAAVVGLGVAAMTLLSNGTSTMAKNISTELSKSTNVAAAKATINATGN